MTMPNGNQPTKKQHYIPQCYLKYFSDISEKQGKKALIWRVDIQDIDNVKLVPIDSVCYKENLYEIKDENGNIIDHNMIEKAMQRYEYNYSKTVDSIKRKSILEKNYNTLCFLSSDEKKNLINFLALLVVRNPYILEDIRSYIDEKITGVSLNTSKNAALLLCIPTKRSERNLFHSVLNLFGNLTFQIGVVAEREIFTSDTPLILKGDNANMSLKEVVFPLSPNLVLYMKQKKKIIGENRNRLVVLSREDICYINQEIYKHTSRWIFSGKNNFDQLCFYKH